MPSDSSRARLILPAMALAAWLALALDEFALRLLPDVARSAAALAVCLVALAVCARSAGSTRAAAGTFAFLGLWLASLAGADVWERSSLNGALVTGGTAILYVIGLGWMVWAMETIGRGYENSRRRAAAHAKVSGDVRALAAGASSWTPLDPAAWYYGRQRPKVNQSIAALAAYSLVFLCVTLAASQLHAGRDSYELPGGGGGGGGGAQVQVAAQQVRVQKVVKKKFVINPYSSIKFEDRSVDDVKLQLVQATDHLYTVGAGMGGAGSGRGKGFGFGDGEGSGFGPGTSLGKVRFIRLEYPGGDWDQDFGVGADLNLLVEYGVRTGQRVADQTEARTVSQLAAFPLGKSPPLVYLTGQKNISLSKADIKALRDFLIEKHGMLFGDNGGSWHFHGQFFGMMQQVLPGVEPVKVPLDDVIHRVPFPIPFLPYVAPHGGKDAWGWKVDGRWVCYYHPGDIGDAWSDGHSGVSREVTEACYQLGVNVIFYAHMEYAKWLQSRMKR